MKQYVIECVNEGHWKPNEQIPTQAELCSHLDVSRITLVRALQDLVASGVLEARQGIGTFVRGDRLVHQLVNAKELYRRTYGDGKSSTYIVLERQKMQAQDAGLEGADFAKGTVVWRVRRKRLQGNQVSSIGELIVPARLTNSDEDIRHLETMLLYDFLTVRCGIRVGKTQVHIGATKLSTEAAELLGSIPGEPALVIRRSLLDLDGKVVAVSHNVHDTSASNYYFEFEEQGDHSADSGLKL